MNTKANSKQQENEPRGTGAIDPHLAELQAIRGLLTVIACKAALDIKAYHERAEVLGNSSGATELGLATAGVLRLLTKFGVDA